MATAAQKYAYRVTSLMGGVEGKVNVQLVEVPDEALRSGNFAALGASTGSLTLTLDAKDAAKYLPGTEFTVTLTAK